MAEPETTIAMRILEEASRTMTRRVDAVEAIKAKRRAAQAGEDFTEELDDAEVLRDLAREDQARAREVLANAEARASAAAAADYPLIGTFLTHNDVRIKQDSHGQSFSRGVDLPSPSFLDRREIDLARSLPASL